MNRKPKFNDDLSDTVCDKDLVVENETLKVKLEETDKENTLKKLKDLTFLLNAKIQTSFHNFKPNAKESLLQENLDRQVQPQFSFQTNSPKGNVTQSK